MIRKLMILAIAACVSCSLLGVGEHRIYSDGMNKAIAQKNSQSDLSIKSFLGFEFGKSPSDFSLEELNEEGEADCKLTSPWRGFDKCKLSFKRDATRPMFHIGLSGSIYFDGGGYKGWNKQEFVAEAWKIIDMLEKKYNITMTKEDHRDNGDIQAVFEGLNVKIEVGGDSCYIKVDITNKEVGRKEKPHSFDADDGADKL